MDSVAQQIEAFRTSIDDIDKEILRLLSRRFGIVRQIGSLKAKNDISIYDRQRERKIIDSLASFAKEHGMENVDRPVIEAVFHRIFAASRDMESSQGTPGER